MRYAVSAWCLALLVLVLLPVALRAEDGEAVIPIAKLKAAATQPAKTTANAAEDAPDDATESEDTKIDDNPVLKDASVQWRSLTRNGQIDLTSGVVNYTINMQGNVSLPKGIQVVALGNPIVITEALDQDGKPMQAGRQDIVNAFGRAAAPRQLNYQAVQLSNGVVQAQSYLQMDRISEKPTKMSSLKGYVPVIVCVKSQTKTLEPVVGDPVRFSDGVTLKVEQFQMNQNNANAGVTIRKPVTDPQRSWEGAMSTPPVAMNLELVDEDGKTIAKADYLYNNSRGSDRNFISMTLQGQFQGITGTVKGIKVTVATRLADKQVPFELKDVPLP